MPAPKRRYYSTQDVMEIMGVGKTRATQYMHMFEQRGQLFRDGKLMRIRIDVFESWLSEKDGSICDITASKRNVSI